MAARFFQGGVQTSRTITSSGIPSNVTFAVILQCSGALSRDRVTPNPQMRSMLAREHQECMRVETTPDKHFGQPVACLCTQGMRWSAWRALISNLDKNLLPVEPTSIRGLAWVSKQHLHLPFRSELSLFIGRCAEPSLLRKTRHKPLKNRPRAPCAPSCLVGK